LISIPSGSDMLLVKYFYGCFLVHKGNYNFSLLSNEINASYSNLTNKC